MLVVGMPKDGDGLPRRRTLAEALYTNARDILYFLLPVAIGHVTVLGIWTLAKDQRDIRGPWEAMFHTILSYTGRDLVGLLSWWSLCWLCVVNWSLGGFFLMLDIYQWPEFLYKHKIQKERNAPFTWGEFFQMLPTIKRHFLYTIPLSFVLIKYLGWRGLFTEEHLLRVPSVTETLGYWFVSLMVHDYVYYRLHRFMHSKFMYKHVHYVHHEFIAPIAATVYYGHWLEVGLTSFFSPSLGWLITTPPIGAMWIWIWWINWQAQWDHCGYHMPFSHSTQFHDFHHLRYHTCYGLLDFWDWYFETDAWFVKSRLHQERHFRLNTLKSASEIIPDDTFQKKETANSNGRSPQELKAD